MKVLFVSSGNKGRRINILADNQARSLRDIGIAIDSFYITEKGLFGYLKSIGKINKCLSEKYDIIHAHYGLCGVVSYLAKKNEKLIVSFMGDDLIGSIKGSSYKMLSKIESFVHRFFARFLYDYSITKSNNLSKKLLNNTKFQIIPNGVDLDRFYPIPKNEAKNKIGLSCDISYILFPSVRDRPEKNFNMADKAFRMLLKSNMTLLEMKNYSRDEINLLYNSVECLMLTSFHEGSPNVIKEAMACNCPIIATRVGDIEQVIGQTKGCFLSSINVVEISDKLEQAITFSSEYGKTNGRDHIKKLGLDSRSIAFRLINLYEVVLGKK